MKNDNNRRSTQPTALPNRQNLRTIKETAEYFGYSERTIYNLIKFGYLPAYHVKGARGLRIRPEDTERVLVRFRPVA